MRNHQGAAVPSLVETDGSTPPGARQFTARARDAPGRREEGSGGDLQARRRKTRCFAIPTPRRAAVNNLNEALYVTGTANRSGNSNDPRNRAQPRQPHPSHR